MGEVSYRLATLSDHDSILDISPDVYGGMDYIMSQLRHLLTDSDYHCFLGETNGKAVAFLIGTLQLCGRKLTLKAGRVREGWRGQGIYGRLVKFLLSYMKEKYPDIETEEFSTNDVNQSISKVYKDNKYTEFMKLSILNYHLKKNFDESCPQDVEELGIDGLRDILRNKEMSARIFPTRIYVAWEMFDPVLSEMQFVEKLHPTILVTLGITGNTPKKDNITALSTVLSYKTLVGLLYLLQIHFPKNTPLTSSKELAQQLIVGNLSRIEQVTEQDLLVICVDAFFKEGVLEAAKALGLRRKDEQYANALIGFNRKV